LLIPACQPFQVFERRRRPSLATWASHVRIHETRERTGCISRLHTRSMSIFSDCLSIFFFLTLFIRPLKALFRFSLSTQTELSSARVQRLASAWQPETLVSFSSSLASQFSLLQSHPDES
jgi:hypothetical protein